MCEQPAYKRGLSLLSVIGAQKECEFSLGADLPHAISVINENGPDCYVSMEVICSGPYVSTKPDTPWRSREKLVPGHESPGSTADKTVRFRTELCLRDNSGGEARPAPETIIIRILSRRRASRNPTVIGEFEHTISIL